MSEDKQNIENLFRDFLKDGEENSYYAVKSDYLDEDPGEDGRDG